MRKDKNYETNFSKISTINDLISYLDDYSERLEKRTYLYHYTTIKKAVDIFQSKKWFLSNAKDMNDQLEYDNGCMDKWRHLFFASFMTDVKENIGMWSMYSQPWEDGVLLQIPKKIVKQWIKTIDKIYEVQKSNKVNEGNVFPINDENKVSLSSIAYSNCDSAEIEEILRCGYATNYNIKNATHISELTGYVKDIAWDYEREIRLKVYLKKTYDFYKVAVDVPEFVYDNMILVVGPLFRGELKTRLQEEISNRIEMGESMFSNKLKIENICTDCKYKNKNQ